MKLSVVVGVFVVVVASFVTMMHIKNGVRDMRGHSHALIQQRNELTATARVLEAERAYLSRSERLAAFAREEGLREIHYRQLVELPELARVQHSGSR